MTEMTSLNSRTKWRIAGGIVVAAALVALAACGGGSGNDSPGSRTLPLGVGAGSAIAWTPGTIAFSLNPGGRQDVPVTFTSETALSNVQVTVVPELRGVVSANPTSFASIDAGKTATVTLRFAASTSEKLGTLEGTVRLTSGNSTLAKPFPVRISLVVPETIHGIPVPPEPPSELNNATLAGFDTNGNGVRDDVERVIASRVSGTDGFARAIVVARAYQRLLTLAPVTQTDSDVAILAAECFAHYNFTNPTGIGGTLIKMTTLNTDSRRKDILDKSLQVTLRVTDTDQECN